MSAFNLPDDARSCPKCGQPSMMIGLCDECDLPRDARGRFAPRDPRANATAYDVRMVIEFTVWDVADEREANIATWQRVRALEVVEDDGLGTVSAGSRSITSIRKRHYYDPDRTEAMSVKSA